METGIRRGAQKHRSEERKRVEYDFLGITVSSINVFHILDNIAVSRTELRHGTVRGTSRGRVGSDVAQKVVLREMG